MVCFVHVKLHFDKKKNPCHSLFLPLVNSVDLSRDTRWVGLSLKATCELLEHDWSRTFLVQL